MSANKRDVNIRKKGVKSSDGAKRHGRVGEEGGVLLYTPDLVRWSEI